jgi:hypothetical protein
MGMAHGPPHDPPKHVTPALIRWQNAIGDQEAGGPQMIGYHPV